MIRAGRFSGKTTLVRTWAVIDPCPESVLVVVTARDDTGADDFWADVAASVRSNAGFTPTSSGDNSFRRLCSALASSSRPVVLVLDGVHTIEGVEDAVDELLRNTAGLRIIVTTRVSGDWGRHVAARSDRTLIDGAALNFTVAEVAALCRASGVPQDERTVQRIAEHTGGMPGLVSEVCEALTSAEIGKRDESVVGDDFLARVVDRTVRYTVASDPTLASFFRLVVVAASTQVPDSDSLLGVLISAGLVDELQSGTEPAWAFPAVVRESLLRIAEADLLERVPDETTGDGLGSTARSPADVRAPSPGLDRLFAMAEMRLRGRFGDAVTISDAMDPHRTLTPTELGILDRSDRHDHALICLHRGITYLLGDRMVDATLMLCRAHSAGSDLFVEREAAGKLALVEAVRGQTRHAMRWLDEERRHRRNIGAGVMVVRTAARVAEALVSMDRLDLSSAADILDDLGIQRGIEEFGAFALFARGRFALLSGTPEDGLRYVDAVAQSLPQPQGGITVHLLEAVRADLHLACGRAEDAQRLVGCSTHPATAPTRARLRLLTGDPGGAEAIVHHESAHPDGWPGTVAELALIGAAASVMRGRRSDARRHLERAAMSARNSGATRLFATLPPSTVRDVAVLGVELPVDVEQVVSDFGAFREIRPTVRLTPRERAVLDALLEGGSAATIAKDQYVSHNTVKSQLRSLYRKLGARSREEAIAAASRLVPERSPE